MPSLRDRREDIPELCDYFIAQTAKATGVLKRNFSSEAMSVLQSYHWAGNIRHLRNIIEWVLIMSANRPETVIDETMLPPELRGQPNHVATNEDTNAIMLLPLREAREVFERQYLITQINRFGGNISKTASFIGMERSALHRKLKLLGLHSDDKMFA